MSRPYASLGPQGGPALRLSGRVLTAERQYTVAEVAEKLKMSRSYVHQLCADGSLISARYGTRCHYNSSFPVRPLSTNQPESSRLSFHWEHRFSLVLPSFFPLGGLMTTYEVAQDYLKAGLNPVPILTDGSKHPPDSWTPLMKRQPTPEEMQRWWLREQLGIGIICGPVSGNLVVIDIDDPAAEPELDEAVENETFCDLIRSAPMVKTPSGGAHIYVRLEDGCTIGNRKLAIGSNRKARIETRGAGGLVVAPGGPPTVHESGKPYQLVRGSIYAIPTLSAEDWDTLEDLIRALSAVTVPDVERSISKAIGSVDDPDSPISTYNRLVDHADEARRRGWRLLRTVRGVEHWQRPGKPNANRQLSATFNYKDSGCWYIFSSNCDPLEPGRSYTPAGFLCAYDYRNDYSALAKDLLRRGYGIPPAAKKLITEKREQDPSLAEVVEPEDVFPELSRAREIVEQKIYDPTEIGLGERLAGECPDVAFCADKGVWYTWDGRCWRLDKGRSDIKQKAISISKRIAFEISYASEEKRPGEKQSDRDRLVAIYKRAQTDAGIKAMINLAEACSACRVTSAQMDAQPDLLNCADGIVDLRTGEIHPHDRKLYLTRCTGINFKNDHPMDQWVNSIHRALNGSDQSIRFLQAIAGYTATGHNRESVLIIAYGPAKTGKSTTIEGIRAALGEYAAAMETSTLTVRNDGVREDLANLVGIRMACASEITEGVSLNQGLVKNVTGGEQISCRHLYGHRFTYTPEFTIWFGLNHAPKFDAGDDAMRRRIIRFPFTHVVPDDQLDTGLKDYVQHEGAQAVLKWIVQGAQMWYQTGLIIPDEIRSATKEMVAEIDDVGEFISSSCKFGPDEWEYSCNVVQAYEQWCEQMGTKPSYKMLQNRLRATGAQACQRRINGAITRIWEGLALSVGGQNAQ